MSRVLAIFLALFAAIAVGLVVVKTGTTMTGTSLGVSTAEAAAKQKVCKSKMPSGKIKSWRCGADQACCVNHDLGIYVCGFAGLGCL